MGEKFDLRLKDHRGIDPDELYGSLGSLFCLKFFHGGTIQGCLTKEYAGGDIDIIDMVDGEKLSVDVIKRMILFLGKGKYKEDDKFICQYRVPGQNMQTGLRKLESDTDVAEMCEFTKYNKMVSVYVEVEKAPKSTDFTKSPDLQRSCGVWSTRKRLDFSDAEEAAKSLAEMSQLECRVGEQEDPDEVMEDDQVHGSKDPVSIYLIDSDKELYASDTSYLPSEDESSKVNDQFFFDTNVDPSVEWYDKAKKEKEDLTEGNPVQLEQLDFDDFDSSNEDPLTHSSRGPKNHRPRNPQFHVKIDMVKPKFQLCQEFGSKKEIKLALEQHSIDSRRDLKVIKNDKSRIRAICKGVVPGNVVDLNDDPANNNETVLECPWTLHASKLPGDSTWQIKTLIDEHRCLQTRRVRACTYKFFAQGIKETIRSNPQIPISALKHDLEEKYQVNVSRMKAFRAKMRAHNLVMGSFQEQYTRLRDYCNEIFSTNPGSTMKIEVESCPHPQDETRVFKRIYCCLGPLKKGFKEGCRPVLGIDGTFIKGPYPGQLLTAIGVDSNNGLYPLAWAIVEAENMRSWEWFLSCLGEDIDLDESSNFCFISDRQKGLIPALAKVFPSAEHRYCLKHIWENFKLQFKGVAYKDLLWSAACATNMPYFEQAMEEIKKLDPKAWDWLKQINPCHWSKSHFSLFPRSDMLYNNLCETFNSKILDARDKPIITCLETIRIYTMNRIAAVRHEIEKCHGILCPNIEKMFEKLKEKAASLRAIWNGGTQYQVSAPFGDQVVVDLKNKSCACRRWDLTGIPCKHAIRAIWSNVENGGDSLPENWVDDCYKVKTWRKIYSHEVMVINGPGLWGRQQGVAKLLPPYHHVQPGRPKKARRKTHEEIDSQRGSQSSQSKISATQSQSNEGLKANTKKQRGGGSVRCNKCGNLGHNSRTCKGQGGSTTNLAADDEVITPNAEDPSLERVKKRSRQQSASTFTNGSSYRVHDQPTTRRTVRGARGAMFWFGRPGNQ